jgi:hypothetical protein
MRSALRVWFPPLVVGLLWAGFASAPLRAEDGMAPDRAMRMFRDPETGAMGRPSAAALEAEAGAGRDAAPGVPLVEEVVRGPAGGVRVRLRGTHRPAVTRHAGPPGAAVHECVDGAGGARE